jgi:hypothetical protein
LNAADIASLLSEFPHQIGGAVRRIVIDKDGFPSDARQCPFEPIHERSDVRPLVQGRYDDSEFYR